MHLPPQPLRPSFNLTCLQVNSFIGVTILLPLGLNLFSLNGRRHDLWRPGQIGPMADFTQAGVIRCVAVLRAVK